VRLSAKGECASETVRDQAAEASDAAGNRLAWVVGGGSDHHAGAAVALDLPFTGAGLHLLRAAVAAHAGQLGVPDHRIGPLVTVASELAANAIRHGGDTGRLRLWRDPTAVFCQVSDHGPGIPDPMIGTQPPDLLQLGGRGVWICRQLCDHLTIDVMPDQHGTMVTAVIAVEPPAARS
jgi:anti-sigma regulatory factor (Ser/Thr protein kinase)